MKNNVIKWLYSVPKRKKAYILLLILIQVLHGASGVLYALLLRNIVADATERGTSSSGEMHAALALSMARNIAIDYGQVLTNEEMEAVVNELFACSNVNYTPDGKAVLCILPQYDIEQLLG